MRGSLGVAGLLVLSACASEVPAAAGGPASPPASVQLNVTNGTGSTVSVFMVWDNGRTRLGDIGPGRTREFTPAYRSAEIALGVDVAAAPPSGTSSAPSGFNATQNARQSNMLVSGVVPVDAGDIILFEIRSLTPRLNVFWRELVP